VTVFSERHGYIRPKEIVFRDELPTKLREPIIKILRRYLPGAFLWERVERLFNRYGIDDWPPVKGALAISKEEDDPDFRAAKRVLLSCDWFRFYDVIEDVFQQLDFYDTELINPDEGQRAYPFQRDINDYFVYAGIGWQLIDGQVLARGDDAFEHTVRTAETELTMGGRTTAAECISKAIRNLSIRPKADLSGAVSQATNAMECVLGDIAGKGRTLGDYLKHHPNLFPGSLKKALEGLWGYASEEGARHGKEGIEPPREEAELIVNISGAVTTYLNRKHPRKLSQE